MCCISPGAAAAAGGGDIASYSPSWALRGLLAHSEEPCERGWSLQTAVGRSLDQQQILTAGPDQAPDAEGGGAGVCSRLLALQTVTSLPALCLPLLGTLC